MKNVIFILAAVFVVTIFSSCKKGKECPHCQIEETQQQPTNVTVNVADTVIINNTNTNNNGGGRPSTTTTTTTTNTSGENNNPPAPDYDYLTGVIDPMAGSLAVGTTYWGFTSVPSACSHSVYDEPCNPIAITITGLVNGLYSFTADPFVNYKTQNGKYLYLKADLQGGSPIKNAITGGLIIRGFPFVVVY